MGKRKTQRQKRIDRLEQIEFDLKFSKLMAEISGKYRIAKQLEKRLQDVVGYRMKNKGARKAG